MSRELIDIIRIDSVFPNYEHCNVSNNVTLSNGATARVSIYGPVGKMELSISDPSSSELVGYCLFTFYYTGGFSVYRLDRKEGEPQKYYIEAFPGSVTGSIK